MTIKSARLHVLQPEKQQDCSSCQMMRRCWSTGPRYVSINLLICRIHRGIDRDKSTRQLLELLKPKIGRITQVIMQKVGPAITPDPAVVENDVAAAIVEYLTSYYQWGDLAFPLFFLFGGKSGVMHRWTLAYSTRKRKEWRNTYPMGGISADADGAFEDRLDRLQSAATGGALTSWDHGESPGEREVNLTTKLDEQARLQKVRQIVDDGMSLSLSEYRVFTFCLDNAAETGRPINGLHAFLAQRMDIVRSRVARLFQDAGRTIVPLVQKDTP